MRNLIDYLKFIERKTGIFSNTWEGIKFLFICTFPAMFIIIFYYLDSVLPQNVKTITIIVMAIIFSIGLVVVMIMAFIRLIAFIKSTIVEYKEESRK